MSSTIVLGAKNYLSETETPSETERDRWGTNCIPTGRGHHVTAETYYVTWSKRVDAGYDGWNSRRRCIFVTASVCCLLPICEKCKLVSFDASWNSHFFISIN